MAGICFGRRGGVAGGVFCQSVSSDHKGSVVRLMPSWVFDLRVMVGVWNKHPFPWLAEKFISKVVSGGIARNEG